jgi:hypothetical protein
MMEALITVVPMRIATSPLGTNILERLDPFGEIVKPKIPYLVEYVQWASQKGKVPGKLLYLISGLCWLCRLLTSYSLLDSVKLAFLESDVGYNTTFATVDGLETEQDTAGIAEANTEDTSASNAAWDAGSRKQIRRWRTLGRTMLRGMQRKAGIGRDKE